MCHVRRVAHQVESGVYEKSDADTVLLSYLKTRRTYDAYVTEFSTQPRSTEKARESHRLSDGGLSFSRSRSRPGFQGFSFVSTLPATIKLQGRRVYGKLKFFAWNCRQATDFQPSLTNSLIVPPPRRLHSIPFLCWLVDSVQRIGSFSFY